MIKGKKGGARPGAGRPKKTEGRDIVQVKLHIYADQREKLKELGGSDWLQKTLDMATAGGIAETPHGFLAPVCVC